MVIRWNGRGTRRNGNAQSPRNPHYQPCLSCYRPMSVCPIPYQTTNRSGPTQPLLPTLSLLFRHMSVCLYNNKPPIVRTITSPTKTLACYGLMLYYSKLRLAIPPLPTRNCGNLLFRDHKLIFIYVSTNTELCPITGSH